MCPRPLRLPIAALLIAFSLVSLLQPIYAVTGRSVTAQSAHQSGQRRGKNGQPVKKSGNAQAQEDATSPDESRDDSPAQQSSPAKQPTVSPSTPGRSTIGSSTIGGSTSGASQSRRQPPPFDRPAGGSGASSSTERQTPVREPAVQTQPRYPQTGSSQGQRQSRTTVPDEPASTPSPAGDVDNGQQQNRTRNQPPVLRRPSDSRNPSDDRMPNTTADARNNEDPDDVAPPVPGTEDETVKLEGTLVNIPLLVSDRSGRYVPRLSERDFALYEDGVQQEIAFFGNQEVPFNVVILLDMSPSVQGNAEAIQDAAIEFVRQLRPQDRVMVASFDRNVDFLTGFTSNRRELESAIRSTSTGSGTSVYDAVYRAVTEKLRGIEGRKALILLSDGEDTTSSHAKYDDAIDIVTESDVLVYGLRYPGGGGSGRVDPWPNTRNPIPQIPIPFPWPFPWPGRRRRGGTFTSQINNAPVVTSATAQSRQGRNRGSDFMTDLATAGGGPVYDADRISDLRGLATKIAEELRHVYVVSYYPTNPLSNGGFRVIRVRVNNRSDIAVRHRRGYQASEMSNRPRT